MSLSDATPTLQQTISEACGRAQNSSPSSGALIRLEKGDYAIQMIRIPKNSSVTLFSKDRVRLLYLGKRNRPMFILEEKSKLTLREKLEIYYNTNNVQEVMNLMIRKSPLDSGVDILKGVKVSLFSQKN
ncbi:MAG: hypothetical protein ACREBS_08455 [Nitrososphaerales archaeon]